MKKRRLCASVLVLLGLGFGRAMPEPEPDGSSPEFEVRLVTEFPPAAMRHDLSAGEIQKLSGRKNAVGWTRLVVDAGNRLEARVETTGSEEKRFWVLSAEVRVGYRSIEVFVASEHPEGSCWHSAILEHENEHVRIDRALVEKYAARIETAVQNAELPTAKRPLWGVEEDEAMKKAQGSVDRAVAPLLAELEKERRKASDTLDSTRAAKQLGKNCVERKERDRE